MRKIFILLSFFVLSFNAFSEVKTYFSPEYDLEAVVTRYLEIASEKVDMAIYTFSSGPMRKVLLQKLDEGVKVRILIDNGQTKDVRAFVEPLIQKGADVRYVTQINHHKFVLLDDEVLVNTSTNFASYHLFKKYDENLTACSSCVDHVEAFKNEFNSLFKFSNYVIKESGDQNPKPTERETESRVNQSVEGVALFTSANFMPYYDRGRVRTKSVDPDHRGMGQVDSTLVEAIESAKHSVWVATGHLRSKPLYDALIRAKKRGVDVQAVLDGQEYISQSKQKKENAEIKKCLETQTEVQCYLKGNHFGRLADSNGVHVRFKYNLFRWHFPYAEQMHHKYMIVDSNIVYTGSYNWSYNAEFNTFENVSIFTDTEVIADFQKNFKKLQNYGGAEEGYKKLMATIMSAKDSIPMVFEPIALSVAQIDKLKKAAFRKCPKLYRIPSTSKSCSF